MAVELYETPTHVFELVWDDDGPEHRWRDMELRLLSGPPLSREQLAHLNRELVRALIDAGVRVRRPRPGGDDPE